MIPFITTLLLILVKYASTTIDINASELEYLSNHLTPEECRRLVAAAHYKSWEVPNALDQAERKISKDLNCLQLLHHWNSSPNEGLGETHEVLEHRLRQIGRMDLADWLGRTVFHELGVDLNRTLDKGFKDLISTSNSSEDSYQPTLSPIIANKNEQYSFADNVLYALVVGLMLTSVGFIARFFYLQLCSWRRKKKQTKQGARGYEVLADETSASESEDKFDLRDYAKK